MYWDNKDLTDLIAKQAVFSLTLFNENAISRTRYPL